METSRALARSQRYLYALVDGLPRGWRPPSAGVGGGAVRGEPVRQLVLISSALAAPATRTTRAEACHQEVLAGLLEARALLPLPFGTAVADEELARWLEARWPRIHAALGDLRDRVEMQVRLLRLEHPLGRMRPAPDATAVLHGVAERLAERAEAVDWRFCPSGHGTNVTACVAFLVERDEVATFLARIAPVAARAQGIAVVPTGPWPPCSFAPSLDGPAVAPEAATA
jgi:hypothetical protein